jgi:hypothetical protein
MKGLLPNSPERLDGVHIFETPIQKCNAILGARMPLESPYIRRENKKTMVKFNFCLKERRVLKKGIWQYYHEKTLDLH